MAESPIAPAEFSRIVPPDRLGEGGPARRISADEAERAALAERLGLLALESLEAEVSLARDRGSPIVRLSGHLSAEVVQACTVTTQPVRQKVEERFAQLFTLDAAGGAPQSDVFVDVEAEDWPEPVGDAGLDIGEAVAQQLSLALDPYPRAEGAGLEQARWGGDENGGGESPFAVLARLKRDR